jgi:hypothetical protein
MREAIRDGAIAGSVAAVLSGIPSTLHALATGRDPLEPTLAAGSILIGNDRQRAALAAAAIPVHLGVSVGWGVVLSAVLPRLREPLTGALAGVGIHVLDLELAGRRFPRIRALPRGPQLADHVAFGAVVGSVLAWRRR